MANFHPDILIKGILIKKKACSTSRTSAIVGQYNVFGFLFATVFRSILMMVFSFSGHEGYSLRKNNFHMVKFVNTYLT